MREEQVPGWDVVEYEWHAGPGGLISKPTLVWELDAATAGAHKARFAYQTGGMTWWTDYNLTYSEPRTGGCRLDVGAWVTIVNQSGASFTDARLKLIAGDVQRAVQVNLLARLPAPALQRVPALPVRLPWSDRPPSWAWGSTCR